MPYSFIDSFVSRVPAYDGVNRGGGSTQTEVRVSQWNDYVTEGMRLDFAGMTVRRFKDWGSKINGIPSISDQRAFVTAEVAAGERVVPIGSGSVHKEPGEIVKPNLIVENDNKDCDFECIMTTEEVEASGLREKMRALQEIIRSASEENPADILAIVALAERRLDLERQVTKRELALVELERKLQVARSAALSAHHSALAKVEEERKCREELEDAEGRLGVAQVVTSETRDFTKTRRRKRPSLKRTTCPRWNVGGMRLV